jgi:hypothetical protein
MPPSTTSLLRLLGAASIALAGASARAQTISSEPEWTIHVGRGIFARSLDVETRSATISVPTIGGSVSLPLGDRTRFELTAGAGALLGGTPGGSTSQGTMFDATALWLVTPREHDWGVFVGPGFTHTRFGVSRTGVGGVVSAGVRRGIGPRLTLRSHAMSGDEIGVATRVELGLVLTR